MPSRIFRNDQVAGAPPAISQSPPTRGPALVVLKARTRSIWKSPKTYWELLIFLLFAHFGLIVIVYGGAEQPETEANLMTRFLYSAVPYVWGGIIAFIILTFLILLRYSNAPFLAIATRNTLAYRIRGRKFHFVRRRHCAGFADGGKTIVLKSRRRVELDISDDYGREWEHFFGAMLDCWQIDVTAEEVRDELRRNQPRFWKYTRRIVFALYVIAIVLLFVIYDKYGTVGFLLYFFPMMLVFGFGYGHAIKRAEQADKNHWYRLPRQPYEQTPAPVPQHSVH